jgi:hypothetical protein
MWCDVNMICYDMMLYDVNMIYDVIYDMIWCDVMWYDVNMMIWCDVIWC